MQRFYTQGCPNCEEFLSLANSSEAVQECTSQVFEGLITMTDPKQSWVAKWQRLDGYVPGVYAVKVVGLVSGCRRDVGTGWALLKEEVLGGESLFQGTGGSASH